MDCGELYVGDAQLVFASLFRPFSDFFESVFVEGTDINVCVTVEGQKFIVFAFINLSIFSLHDIASSIKELEGFVASI